MSTYDFYIDSQMACGIHGCNHKTFFVDMETFAHLSYVHLICLECKYGRKVSRENYQFMIDIENYLLYQSMHHGVNWTEDSIRKVMVNYENK